MRFEGRKKMGYFPTPISVVERIKSFISFNKYKNKTLDPCCGEGHAIFELVKDTRNETFGIELDICRAEESRKILDHLLKSSFENSRISNNSFNLLFLNPPYDDENTIDGANIRKEKIFLIETLKYLQTDGLLVYIIPQRRLDKSVAKILSYRFADIRVYRFHGSEYDAFNQIVVLATKKKKSSVNNDLMEFLQKIPLTELSEVPMLDTPLYNLPEAKNILLFKSTEINIDDLKKETVCSNLWDTFHNLVEIAEHKVVSPPLPIRMGHVAQLLLSGKFDGVAGKEAERHLVRGKVEKVLRKTEEIEGKNSVIRETEEFKVSVKLLFETGELRVLA